jgi:hypothetical protein
LGVIICDVGPSRIIVHVYTSMFLQLMDKNDKSSMGQIASCLYCFTQLDYITALPGFGAGCGHLRALVISIPSPFQGLRYSFLRGQGHCFPSMTMNLMCFIPVLIMAPFLPNHSLIELILSRRIECKWEKNVF